FDGFGGTLAGRGVGVVLVNHRFGPPHVHPAQVEDVARAIAWTHKNIAEYGGRADQIILGGHSSGAHLVALAATDESYLKAHGLTPETFKGVIGISGRYVIRPGAFPKIFGDDPE